KRRSTTRQQVMRLRQAVRIVEPIFSLSGGGAFAERWVRSVKQERLSKLILFGEGALHHLERNHQGKGNALLFPTATMTTSGRRISGRERLGGLLRYYSRAA